MNNFQFSMKTYARESDSTVKQIRGVFSDKLGIIRGNFSYFSIKTYVVGTH